MKQQTTGTYRRLTLALVVVVILGASTALAQIGGGYDLTWSTIDSGGGSSTGTGYQLTGTIGQPDAGAVLNGGSYSLSGGFWGGVSTGNKIYLPLLLR